MLPGIHLSAVGARNEAMIYLRGFDLRQVPLLIDGIPVYIPYDGYVDLARFTTFDLAAIHVSKGYTSVLYGPNALGGAINLVTSKSVKQFELNGASGWLSGSYRANINIGSNLGKFYIQASASKMNRDSFPLSSKFKPTKTENGNSRNNSYSTDEKYSIKLGYTPGKRSEYALSYMYQHGKKGSPVYAGNDTLNSQLKSPATGSGLIGINKACTLFRIPPSTVSNTLKQGSITTVLKTSSTRTTMPAIPQYRGPMLLKAITMIIRLAA